MPSELEIMREKRQLRIGQKNIKLFGYTLGTNAKEITENLNGNDRNSSIANKFTAYLLEIMWSYLLSKNEIQK